jgi:hypothetical protein
VVDPVLRCGLVYFGYIRVEGYCGPGYEMWTDLIWSHPGGRVW